MCAKIQKIFGSNLGDGGENKKTLKKAAAQVTQRHLLVK
jgi:hypothetical protein